MKNLTLVILFFISSIITCNAQEPTQYTKAVELLQQGKQDSLKVYLENWENTEPPNITTSNGSSRLLKKQ